MINDVKSYPEQALRDNLAYQKNWAITSSFYDEKNKNFVFEVVVNCNETKTEIISYNDACSMQGWKSFKLSENKQTVYPVIDKVALQKDIDCIEKFIKLRDKKSSSSRSKDEDETKPKFTTVWKFN